LQRQAQSTSNPFVDVAATVGLVKQHAIVQRKDYWRDRTDKINLERSAPDCSQHRWKRPEIFWARES
jgi:hypothetical protein